MSNKECQEVEKERHGRVHIRKTLLKLSKILAKNILVKKIKGEKKYKHAKFECHASVLDKVPECQEWSAWKPLDVRWLQCPKCVIGKVNDK